MNDAETAIATATAGSTVVRQCFGGQLRRFEKGSGDFSTSADIEAERAMLALLRAERPNDGMLAEESGQGGRPDSHRTWLIDPLCGTLNYAVRMRVAAVNVALRKGTQVTAAAVADPFNEEIFWTGGGGAYKRTADGDTTLQPDPSSSLVDLNFDPPFPNAPNFSTVGLAASGEFASRFRPRVVSTSLALAWVATGQRAAYVTDGDVRDSVHFAAGLAICEAAGCAMSNLRGRPWGDGPTGLIAAADQPTLCAIAALASGYIDGTSAP